jgi:hypothetical protein
MSGRSRHMSLIYQLADRRRLERLIRNGNTPRMLMS